MATQSLRERLFATRRSTTSTTTGDAAQMHIDERGQTVIDLTVDPAGNLQSTSDLPCPNCGATMHVGEVDKVAKLAYLWCSDCHFHMHHKVK